MGSRKMKLVTVGLALASVAQALDCINDPVELSGELLANWCDANASKCTDFDVDPCYDRNAEDMLEPRSTTMDDAQETEDASHDMSNKIRPKSGVEIGAEVEVSRTWVDDVEEYCRTNKKACRYHWGLKVARKLLNFKDQMDNVFKQEAAEHYKEFMSFADDRCFKRIQQCHSEIKSVGSVEIPSYENFWNFSCMECFVMSMRLIKLHAVTFLWLIWMIQTASANSVEPSRKNDNTSQRLKKSTKVSKIMLFLPISHHFKNGEIPRKVKRNWSLSK